ncbi:TonB-dependent receptor plug domain-containing protein [Hanstruepera flava]|uniref:TonB-dependent receptor plug domain-containing protein n=1 Tax=Hanstruepera flava TaxID=2930218 RepID=UPI0020279587|nr:TonB-dependent receptor [Hanstruepera flava]
MSKRLVIIVFCFFLIATTQLQGQNRQPLSVVLKTIEVSHGINFTYADINVVQKNVSIPKTDLKLNELIIYLEHETGLVFEKLSTDTFAIRKLEFTDITKTQFLEEVVLKNYLTQGILLNDDGTTLLKLNEFGILPGLIEPDVLQTIQALPGIISVDERVSNLNIRGGTHDQNLILWDGIKMYQSGHFFGLISPFNRSLIDNVVISKNGTSAKYGDGVSGIIDMQSSNKRSNTFSGELGMNLIAADGFVKIPLSNKIEFQLAARRSLTDLYETPTYNQYFKRIFQDSDLTNTSENVSVNNERLYFYDLSSKLIYDISKKDKLAFSFLNIYNSLDYQETINNNNFDISSNSNLSQGSLAFSTQYTRNWSNQFKTIASFYYSDYDLYAKNQDLNNNQKLIQENEVLDGGLKLQAIYNIDKNLNYSGGYQFTEVGIGNLEDVDNPEFRRYIKEVVRTHSIYNELLFKSNSGNTHARLGLRANYIEKFSDFFFEPRISINQTFLKDFRIEILGELKSQTTSQIIDLQNDFLGIEKRRWVLANNKDIPLIQSQQISTGIHYNKNGLLVSLEGYYKYVDGITSPSQGFQNQYQFVNVIGAYNVRGVDFLINKQFSAFSTWLSYSFSKNNYKFADLNNNNSFPNNLDIRHQLTLAGTYTINNLKVALGLNWHSGRPTTSVNNNISANTSTINYNSPNSENLPDYWRSDFSATYNIKLSKTYKGHFGISVWNIFDTRNVLNSYYTKDSNSNLVKIENTSLSITPNVSFRVSF